MKKRVLCLKRRTIHHAKGFTLLEMLIVLVIISLLVMLIIPNILQHKKAANAASCKAYANMAETQVQAYTLEKGRAPGSLNELVSSGYLKKATCPDGTGLVYTHEEVRPAK